MTGLRLNQCPTGCGRKVGAGKLLCGPCWAKVPRDLQQRVYATWRSLRTDTRDTTARAEYKDARDNAIASIA